MPVRSAPRGLRPCLFGLVPVGPSPYNDRQTDPLRKSLDKRPVSIRRDFPSPGEPGLKLLTGGEKRRESMPVFWARDMLNGLQTEPRAISLDLFSGEWLFLISKVRSHTSEKNNRHIRPNPRSANVCRQPQQGHEGKGKQHTAGPKR